jgi:precorrin-2/cobalt-factor-2 C20-methyltransferase
MGIKMNDDSTIKQNKTGRLYGVGVGPGDPELLTLKAHRIISRVPFLFIPQKNEKSKSYAHSIIEGLINNTSQKIEPLIFPMQKDTNLLEPYWENACRKIWHQLSLGNDCAFITEGDPFLYSTFIYIFNIFKKHYPEVDISVIPGITSVNAASTSTMIPLASNKERVAILPATYFDDIEAIRNILRTFDTVVMLKIDRVFDKVLQILEDLKLENNCIYIRRCTTKDEEIVTDIKSLKGETLDYMSLLMIRKQ